MTVEPGHSSEGKSGKDDVMHTAEVNGGSSDAKPERKDKKHKKDKSEKEKKDKKDKKSKKDKKEKKEQREKEKTSKRSASPTGEDEEDSNMEEAKKTKLSPSSSAATPKPAEGEPPAAEQSEPEDSERMAKPGLTKDEFNKAELAKIARASTADLADALDEKKTSEKGESTPTTPETTASSELSDSVRPELELSDSQKMMRHAHMNRYYRSLKRMDCPKEIKRLARDARAGKDSAALADLLEDFFNCKGNWKKSKTMRTMAHRTRSKRQSKKVWKTLAELQQRYAHEKDPGSLAQALFDEKMKANLHRPHPNFPDKEDMIQVKVFDTEEELSESEDELAVEGRLEASDSEEGLEDEDPEQADTPGDDKSSRKRTPKAKAKRRAKAKAKGSANKQRRGHEDTESTPEMQREKQKKKVMKDISAFLSDHASWELKLRNSGVNDGLLNALVGDITSSVEALRGHRTALEGASDGSKTDDEIGAVIDKAETDITKHKNAILAARKHIAKPPRGT